MTIVPRDPITRSGWKNVSFQYLSKQTGKNLQRGLENYAYKYEEIVINTKYPVVHEMKIANTRAGLIHLLDRQAGPLCLVGSWFQLSYFIKTQLKAPKVTYYLGGISYLSLCLYGPRNTSDLISDFEWTNQLPDSPSEHYTFSPETSQTITLNGSRGYFVTISDPVFSVSSPNPETIPRNLINLPPGGGTLQIYLTVKYFSKLIGKSY